MPNEILRYDAIVIGSGQGGNPLAQALAGRGERVVLIESDHLGGTCINTGCTPTKTMVASAQIAYYARQAARWGVRVQFTGMGMKTVLERKKDRVMAGRTGWEKSVDGPGPPKLFRGRARFVSTNPVEIA